MYLVHISDPQSIPAPVRPPGRVTVQGIVHYWMTYWNTIADLHSVSQQLGSEVERQGKANKSTTPRTALSFQRKVEELPWVHAKFAIIACKDLLRYWV